MQRVTIAEAEREFSTLVNRVYSEGISVELEREEKVIARLTPASPQSSLKVQDLNAFLEKLPRLDDDAEAFSEDLRTIRREFPSEASAWD